LFGLLTDFMNASLLILSFLGTKLFGLDRTARAFTHIGRLRRRLPGIRRFHQAGEVARQVTGGLRFIPLPIECLDQALVTWYALNVHGHGARLRIGMKLSPVAGHAWVVCGDESFVQIPGLEDFTVVAEYSAWA
jgi:Transglutaminase-like superfamily